MESCRYERDTDSCRSSIKRTSLSKRPPPRSSKKNKSLPTPWQLVIPGNEDLRVEARLFLFPGLEWLFNELFGPWDRFEVQCFARGDLGLC